MVLRNHGLLVVGRNHPCDIQTCCIAWSGACEVQGDGAILQYQAALPHPNDVLEKNLRQGQARGRINPTGTVRLAWPAPACESLTASIRPYRN